MEVKKWNDSWRRSRSGELLFFPLSPVQPDALLYVQNISQIRFYKMGREKVVQLLSREVPQHLVVGEARKNQQK